MANASMDTQTSVAEKTATASNGKWISKESYQEMIERVPDLLSKANKSATGMVREYPIQAAVGGLVIGFLLGSIFSRRAS